MSESLVPQILSTKTLGACIPGHTWPKVTFQITAISIRIKLASKTSQLFVGSLSPIWLKISVEAVFLLLPLLISLVVLFACDVIHQPCHLPLLSLRLAALHLLLLFSETPVLLLKLLDLLFGQWSSKFSEVLDYSCPVDRLLL